LEGGKSRRNRSDSISALLCCGFTEQTSNAQRSTSNAQWKAYEDGECEHVS
jgi:hypothetical protein